MKLDRVKEQFREASVTYSASETCVQQVEQTHCLSALRAQGDDDDDDECVASGHL